MLSELTIEDVWKLIDSLQNAFDVEDSAMADTCNQKCHWYFIRNKYEDFVRAYLSNFFMTVPYDIICGFLNEPLSSMPLYINEVKRFQIIAKWRLSIGK
jgi:hypothetical protein